MNRSGDEQIKKRQECQVQVPDNLKCLLSESKMAASSTDGIRIIKMSVI